MIDSSTPSLTEFDPKAIPFQYKLIYDIRKKFDYNLGVHEILASGAVGSSKSLVGAHLGITHGLLNPGARVLLGRRTLPSLKDTLIRKCIDHIGGDFTYWTNRNRGTIWFSNGSMLMPYSWADGNFKKVRSEEFSAAIIEELTENKEQEFYDEIKMRVGRLNHVKEKWILNLTNPDSPKHWAYKYFIQSKLPTRHVYYSKTSDNPFLPTSYMRQLEETLDPKMKRRMLDGEWLELDQDRIYYSYDSEFNYRDYDYKINPSLPIRLHFDFNIGEGKPLSMVMSQFVQEGPRDLGTWHFFGEVIVHGQDTGECMDETIDRGILEKAHFFIVHGDASGRNRDTRSKVSDYDIIEKRLANWRSKDGRRVQYKIEVPRSNPPLRERHNISNAYMCSSTGMRRLFVYKGCPTLDEGFRLTALKKNGLYIEDDSPQCPYQHCTTAATYGVMNEYYAIDNSKNTGVYALRG